MLEEATGALARLDAGTLEELEMRASRLLASGVRVMGMPEVAARHRVFAAVVRATGENLAVLERARAPFQSYRVEKSRDGVTPWVR